MTYAALEHDIDGAWTKPSGARARDVVNPANNAAIGRLFVSHLG